MKVAYIVSRFPTVSETFIVRELDAVSERGIEIELFRLFPSKAATLHPATRRWLHRLHLVSAREAAGALLWWLVRRPGRLLVLVAQTTRGYARDPLLLWRALVTVAIAAGCARRIRSLEIDHVHAHWATYPALAAWVCRQLTGVPYSFTAHAHDLYEDRSFLATKVRDARHVITISDYNRRFFADLPDEVAATPVHVVRCGIHLDRYRFRPRAPRSDGPVRALCVAGLNRYKGQWVLLEALAADDPQLRRLSLDLVGDGPLRSQLERLVESLGLVSRVRFLGTLTEDDVAALLDRADLFVLPSVMDSLPVAAMESLAAGVPVVATRVLGVPELVRDGETGVLAEPGEVESLRAALRRVLDDPPAARRRAIAGRRLVETAYDVRLSADRMVTLFYGGGPHPSSE